MTQKTKITPGIFPTSSSELREASIFREWVFDRFAEEAFLNAKIVSHLDEVRKGSTRFDPTLADAVADGMKRWAMQHGASYYTHWFQPLTHLSGEKHDSFLSWGPVAGSFVLRFSGKELMFGEPDASSFPSGGLRSTHEARGYTAWDPTSFPFLWESGEGITLYIPAVFYSWKGIALDHKIPLLRSNQKIEAAALRLLSLCNLDADAVSVTLGIEQEYFLLDAELVASRPDLTLTGRTIFGAKPSKGQELEDHYCGVVQPHALEFMRDFEEGALRLGIPLKTRHNEVAPRQHEVAPLFENASIACDHNLLLMEVMRQSAAKFGLSCLFHEKPFLGLNGSGKHNNWSLATDKGLNLLDPKGNSLLFLTMLAAVVRGVHEHAGLLRASIGSANNDHRLGGSEAPPSIISIFLGDALEKLVHDLIQEKPIAAFPLRNIDLGLEQMPSQVADASDRNRTSFFVFTGNKFEFRAVGSSASCAFPVAILNSIVADSLQLILDEMEDAGVKIHSDPMQSAIPVLKKHFQVALPVLFAGNNYSAEWQAESKKRGLPNFTSSLQAFHVLLDKKTIRVLENVLTEKELSSRFEIMVEQYAKTLNLEMTLMLEIFTTQIVPSVQKDMSRRFALLQSASSFGLKMDAQHKMVSEMNQHLEEAIGLAEEMALLKSQAKDFGWEAKAKVFCELILPKMEQLRKNVDTLELQTDHEFWPMIKVRELLF